MKEDIATLKRQAASRDTLGGAEFQNPEEYLCSVKQTSTVQEYHREFMKRSARVFSWPENCLLGVFLNGLKGELKPRIRIFRPRTVYDAINCAVQIEAKVSARRSRVAMVCTNSKPRPPTTPTTTAQPKTQPPRISDFEKKMLEAADETDVQTSPEEEEHKNKGEMKNAELEQKLLNRDDILKLNCENSHKDPDQMKAQADRKQSDCSFQKAIKVGMDDKVDWLAKRTNINSGFRISTSNGHDSFLTAPKFELEKTHIIAYRWVQEVGQPTI